MNLMVWIPAQFLNFSFIPTKYNVLFSNMIGLAWNAYLSYMTYNNVKNNNDTTENNKIIPLEKNNNKL